MFLHVSVILSGGGLPQVILGYPPSGRHYLGAHPLGQTLPPPQEHPVRILLECIFAGSLKSANSSILAPCDLFKEEVGKKSEFYDN